MRQPLIMANWKMNGRIAQVTLLLNDLISALSKRLSEDVVIFPPALYLPLAQSLLRDTCFNLGAQNVYPKDNGAFTGELSGPMVKEYGCRYVLVGHSERRHVFHEDEKIVTEKFHHVKESGMIPVLCVGETLEQRQRGLTEAVITQQLQSVLKDDSRVFQQCVVAYEPVWAIGTGQSATPELAQDVHAMIRALVGSWDPQSAEQLCILYGGSVTEKNANALFSMPDVDGGLVGGASLQAQSFVEIVKCINLF